MNYAKVGSSKEAENTKLQIALMVVALITALFTFQAASGCGHWVIRDNTDYLKDPIFDDAVNASTMSGAAGPENATDNAITDSVKPTPEAKKIVEKEPSVPDVSGKWFFKLPANLGGSLDLILIQSGSRLQGYAQVAENGGHVAATATGTVSQDSVNLDVRTVKSTETRKLDLALYRNSLEGSCELYKGDQLLERGNATATRNGS